MLNFPDLLDVTKISPELSSTDDETIRERVVQSSYNHKRRARSHSPGTYSGWIYTPLKEVKLPQMFQRTPSPSSIGCCVPRSNSPVQRWASFNSEEELTQFLHNSIPSHSEGDCKDCERITTAPSLQT